MIQSNKHLEVRSEVDCSPHAVHDYALEESETEEPSDLSYELSLLLSRHCLDGH
jgi:hypothetical protein